MARFVNDRVENYWKACTAALVLLEEGADELSGKVKVAQKNPALFEGNGKLNAEGKKFLRALKAKGVNAYQAAKVMGISGTGAWNAYKRYDEEDRVRRD